MYGLYKADSMMLSVSSMTMFFVPVPVSFPRVSTLRAAVSPNMRQPG